MLEAKKNGKSAFDDDEDKSGADYDLDALWAKFREFLQDLQPNGEKREIKGTDKPTRIRFSEACQTYDPRSVGTISRKQLQQAFTVARLSFEVSEADWDKVISAVEAWHNREEKTVNYRRFLDATFAREVTSMHGIFPKLQKREMSKFELERKAKLEEDEKKEKEKAEEEKLAIEKAKLQKEIDA